MNAVNVWRYDIGDIVLPDDFPSHAMRKCGWPDKRWKITTKVFDYIEAQKRQMWNDYCAGGSVGNFKAPSFAEWRP